MLNINLISAVAKLDSEYVNIELGRTEFVSATVIDEIGKTFGINLTDIDNEFQNLKDTKYKYEEFCNLCDEGKEDEHKLYQMFLNMLKLRK